MNKRLSLAMMLSAAAAAGGQTVSPPQPARQAAPPTAAARTDHLPTQFAASRGSLLRATIGRAPNAVELTAAQVSPFAVPEPEPKVLRKHDLITIIVREESYSSSEGTTDLSRENDVNAAIEEFISLNPANWAIQGNAQGPNPPAIQLNSSRTFNGDASVDRTDKLTFRIAAEVVDVKPNGTVVVQARKHLRNDDEDQLVTITGICRVDDLTPDNTILSSQLHDLEVVRKHEGAVRDTTRRGWLLRLLDAVTPM